MNHYPNGIENEPRWLHVPAPLADSHIASDAAGRSVRIEIVPQRESQPELLAQPFRVLARPGSHGHDPGIQLRELGPMLLEVSQLLTALLSPLPPVEEDNGMASPEIPRELELPTGHGLDFEVRKSVTDLEGIHRTPPAEETNEPGGLITAGEG
jgi:hypothetical protein